MDGRKLARYRRGASALIALSLYSPVYAQSPAPTPAMAAVSTALGHLKAGGTPLVVVVTSSSRPDSHAFCRALIDGQWARANRGLVQIVELPAEANAATVERLRVASTPCVLAYTAGPEGPVCRGMRAGGSPDEAADWLAMLGIGESRAPAVNYDTSVVAATHDGYPSPQQPYSQPPPTPAPPVTSVPTYAAQPPPTYYAPTPVMAAPMPAPTASYVQLPGPNVVVHQGEPRVFVTQSPAGPPSYAAQPPAGNLYLPTAAPPPVSYAAMPAPPPAPVAYAAMPAPAPVAYAAAPAPTAFAAGPMPYAAVTNQTMALPTVGSRTRIRVHGPGPIRSGLASLGEKMTQLGRSRIETVHETELNTPAVQGGGGVATFATTSAAPVGMPHLQTAYVPQPVAAPPQQPVYESAPPVTPSPQEVPHKHGHFLKKLNDGS